jgi:hypothetical protein
LGRPLPPRAGHINDDTDSRKKETSQELQAEVIVEVAPGAVDLRGQNQGLRYRELTESRSQTDQDRPSGNEQSSRPPSPPFGKVFVVLVIFALAITLILFIFVGSVVVSIKLIRRLYRFGHNHQFGAVAAVLLLFLTLLALFCSAFVLPRQVAIVKSWESTIGPIGETSFWSNELFGIPQNSFEVDVWGQLTELHLQHAPINTLKDLPDIDHLSALQVLEVADTPLSGTLDVSPFTQLREIHLRNTGVSALRGLDKLPNLDTLDLESSAVQRLETVGTAKTLNLAKTHVLDLTFLMSASQLENLNLSGSDLTHLVGLDYGSTLKKLDLSHCTSVPLDQVALLDGLRELKLDYSDVRQLSPLSSLSNLMSISLVGTKVGSSSDLGGTKAALLDVRETSLSPQELAKANKNQMAIIYGDKVFWQQVQEEQQTRSKRFRILSYLILLWAVVLFVPIPLRLQRRWLLVTRRIARRLVLGALFIVWLQPGVYSDLPIYFANSETPFILKIFKPENKNIWAACAGLLWLIGLPVLEALLETKAVGKTKWLPAVQRVSRLTPALAIFVPVIILVTILLALMIHPIAFPSTLIFLIPLIIIVAGAIWLSIFLYVPSVLWSQKLTELQRFMSAENPSRNRLMVVALHYRLLGTGARAVIGSFYDAVVKDIPPRKDASSHLMMVPNIGMLADAPMSHVSASALSGVVFFVPQEQLERARPWELKLLRDWSVDIYQHSSLPVWVIADWVEDTEAKSAALVANMKLVNSLLPYISGIEKNLQADPLVIIRTPPKAISECLEANGLALQTKQQILTLNSTLQQAFTPVASLLRLVFGYANFFDRLDALLRATEFSVAYFTLVLAIEVVEQGSAYPALELEKLHRLVALLNQSLTFDSWRRSFVGLVRRTRSPMAISLGQVLDAPAVEDAKDLTSLLMAIRGSTTYESTHIRKREDTLSLLRDLRNVTTGHGPATQRISPDLYLKALATVMDFVSSLPWSNAAIQHISTMGLASTFRGCLPTKHGAVGKQAGNYLVIRNDPHAPAVFDASRYFYYIEDTGSIALFVGKDGYLDPLSGIRIPA